MLFPLNENIFSTSKEETNLLTGGKMPPKLKDVAQLKNHYVVIKGQGKGLNKLQEAGPMKFLAEALKVRKRADAVIKSKWDSLNGAPGQPIAPDSSGLKEIGQGYYREYANGTIYFLAPALAEAIERRKLILGSPPCWVHGAILARYNALGGPEGELGWPTGDEERGTEGGQYQTFSTHNIYWWPDTGAIEMTGSLVVTYSGLACFGETDDDQLSSADEPYVILGAIPPPPLPPFTGRTQIYTDVDAGDSREQQRIELYRGLPLPLSVSPVLMEHDLSDPSKYQETTRVVVEQASKAVAMGIGAIPYVGPFLGPLAEAGLKAIGPDIVEALDNAFNFSDDYIGIGTFMISTKQMVTLARAPKKNYKGILWDLDSPLISGQGASYKVYVYITNE
jgi:hypothetical protein